MKHLIGVLLVSTVCSSVAVAQPPPLADSRESMPAAVQLKSEMFAKTILESAYEAAGGDSFTRPKTLWLKGYNIIRAGDKELLWDKYSMWREYASNKTDAHEANGKVRIEGWTNGKLQLLLSFDGKQTYNQNGLMEDQSANEMWANSFGFGAIRHALDDGWSQKRVADRQIDGEPAYMIELTDPSEKQTLFGIRQSDFAIVYVGFDTPRGWHERRYSHFFEKPDVSWKQAGRVRLFYNGQKANEAVWTDFEVNTVFSDENFVITGTPSQPEF